ncbi:hypothetical protein A4H97_20185 [Niastella yeongjuensis]|uniref:DUF3575 domain-containing protein n=1 Tax=Niastella yeongjuensis TaxID=354355 RepID=A0A1V9FC95_9BACT|nr:DUF3575 domain-containing protein [Niastella yeongjuensis]OQP55911.1 hypothetical protein A4H97_20185 [Niastella yeongjuensis]SEP27168.1 Protein of unknown function [Niastella yeongjuensis]
MYQTCLLCLLLLVTTVGNSQHRMRKPWPGDTSKICLRMNFLGLLDNQDGNGSIGGEVRLNKTWSAIMDAGYIFYSEYFKNADKASGFILRPGFRAYLNKYRNMYVDLQMHYKNVRYTINDYMDNDAMNNPPANRELKEFQIQKRVVGGQILFGGKLFLSRNYRWFFEFYIGLGLRYKEEYLYNEPDGEYGHSWGIFRAGTLTPKKSTMVVAAVPYGMRLVFAIR